MSEAVVTPDRIALDWIENGVRYHLLATAGWWPDVPGNYGMFRQRNNDHHADSLHGCRRVGNPAGTWYEKDRGNEGSSLFELKPQPPAPLYGDHPGAMRLKYEVNW